MDAITEQEILAGLSAIVERIAGVPAAEVTPEKSFLDDLGVDSLSLVEISVVAQETFGVDGSDAQLRTLSTVGDAVAFIDRARS